MERDNLSKEAKSGRRDFLSLFDLPDGALIQLLDTAEQLRRAFAERHPPLLLQGRAVLLWFEGSGFRNRVAFELGIASMGGIAVHMPGRLGEREEIEDIASYLDNWFDCAVVRADDHAAVQRLAEAARMPVINARTSVGHPCEVLGDLAYVRSIRSGLDGLRVVFVGDTTNLCHSWFEAAVQLPIEVVQICPPGYETNAAYVNRLNKTAVGSIHTSHDLPGAVRSADVIYTDCWPSAESAGQRQKIARSFGPYCVTKECLALAPEEALFLPCPPVHRGEEVSAEAMTDPRCRVYAAKEYLLHAQNAVLTWAMN